MTHLEPQAPPAAVAVYRDALRHSIPSSALDERIDRAIQHIVGKSAQRAHASRWRTLGPAIAAGVTALLVAGVMVWLALGEREALELGEATDAAPGQGRTAIAVLETATTSADTAFAVAPTGTYSLWPTESAVFRVQTRLDAVMPGLAAAGSGGEQRFWVDVRVANDGTMRIVRIVPVDEGV